MNTQPGKEYIKNHNLESLKELVSQMGYEHYRAKQIYHALFTDKVNSFDEITTLPVDFREKLKEKFEINTLNIKQVRRSEDGSVKFLFSLRDGKSIEAVYMPWYDSDGQTIDRVTLCISSMAGCPVGCAFCATGTLGFLRNLEAAEIIEQVIAVEKELGEKITNVVYMGMGEPLLNYKNVARSMELMTDPDSDLLSRRKVTLSTSGVAPRIKQLAKEPRPVKLAISLHATTNGTRRRIMPITESFDIRKLMDAVEEYYRNTKMQITYEYILFDGLNDTKDDAKRLAKIAKRVPSRVNIIPYNDISFTNPTGIAAELKRASKEKTYEFARQLKEQGAVVVLRDTFGGDIEAACGQLALSEGEKEKV
ncbi:MAG: 23S rRNA (adenine(2503)-C(2))-methyltransferase RlmN [Candidatus Kapaibacterium sp.]